VDGYFVLDGVLFRSSVVGKLVCEIAVWFR